MSDFVNVGVPRHQAVVLDDIVDERQRQDEQWGVQNHHPAYWLAILGKQVGQLGSAVLDREWYTDPDKGTAIVRAEAVQVAAVAMALIENIDDPARELPQGLTTAKPEDPRQLAKALGRGDEAMPYDQDEPVEKPCRCEHPHEECRDECHGPTCYHCGLPIRNLVKNGMVWTHVDVRAYHELGELVPRHAARWEPDCIHCERDNANGTHDALERAGHLNHHFEPEVLPS